MPTEAGSLLSGPLLPGLAALAATYLVHSTVALGGAWLALRVFRPRSPALDEQLWKTAAVLGVATATAQCAFGLAGFELPLGTNISGTGRPAGHESDEIAAPEWPIVADAPRETPDVLASRSEALPELLPLTVEETDRFTASDAVLEEPALPVLLAGDEATVVLGPVVPVVDPPAAELSPAHPALPAAEHSATHAPSARAPLVGVLGAGALLFLVCGILRLIVQTAMFQRRLAGVSEITSGRVRCELDRLVRRAGVRRRVRLIASRDFQEPFACGAVRWRIVVPDGLEERLGRDELRSLLAHELAHLVRGDARWLWIGRVLCSCLAFQPLNFLARRRWQRAEECLCDDWAVRHGGSPLALARCLTRVAEWRIGGKPAPAALAAGGARSTLSRRVERLVTINSRDQLRDGRLRRHVVRTAALAAAIALAWCGPRASFSGADMFPPAADSPPTLDHEDHTVPADVVTELGLLDRELDSLERQIQRLDALLTQRSDDDLEHLATRLRLRMQSLGHHRAALASHTDQITRPVPGKDSGR